MAIDLMMKKITICLLTLLVLFDAFPVSASVRKDEILTSYLEKLEQNESLWQELLEAEGEFSFSDPIPSISFETLESELYRYVAVSYGGYGYKEKSDFSYSLLFCDDVPVALASFEKENDRWIISGIRSKGDRLYEAVVSMSALLKQKHPYRDGMMIWDHYLTPVVFSNELIGGYISVSYNDPTPIRSLDYAIAASKWRKSVEVKEQLDRPNSRDLFHKIPLPRTGESFDASVDGWVYLSDFFPYTVLFRVCSSIVFIITIILIVSKMWKQSKR